MISKLARWQLVLFVLIGLVGVAVVGAQYIRLDRFLGFGTYSVYADFEESGGIFTNAEVTYRGTPVGRVGSVELNGEVVRVELELDKSRPRVPNSASALVMNRSAVGEQYVDLQPQTDSAEVLQAGDVIPATRTGAPVAVEDFLRSTNSLLQDVPLDDLATVVNELGDAFDGRGAELETLLTSLDKLSAEGVKSLPDIQGLIEDGAVVLGTQAEQSGIISGFAADLKTITEQLEANDGDIRRLVTTSREAGDTLTSLTDRVQPDLTQVLHQGSELVVDTIKPRDLAVRALVTLLPPLSGGSFSVAPGDGTIHFGLVLEINNPPACAQGYEGTYERLREERAKDPSFNDQVDGFEPDLDVNCTAARGDPSGVRNAAKAQYFDPDVQVPWDNTPKRDPDKLNLNPLMTQVGQLLGVTYNK